MNPKPFALERYFAEYEFSAQYLLSSSDIERFDIGTTYLFLLGQGSLLNLAVGAGPYGIDQFDHYTAVMLLGIAWMFDGIPEDIVPGLHGCQKLLN